MTTARTSSAAETPAETEALDLPRRTRRRYRRFAARVLMIFAPVHIYVGWSLLPDLPVAPAVQVLGALLLAVSSVLIPYGTLALIFFRDPDWVDRLVWAGSLTMGLFSSVLILTLIRDLLLWGCPS